MGRKRRQLRVELRIVPVRMQHRRLQIVRDRADGHPAEVAERVFQTPQEGLRLLIKSRLAVALARAAQHGAKDVRTPASARFIDDPRAGPKIHLQLLARGKFHPPEWHRRLQLQSANKALHRLVAAGKTAVANQVLVDPFRRKTLVEAGLDFLLPAGTQTHVRLGGRQRLREQFRSGAGRAGAVRVRRHTFPGDQGGRFWLDPSGGPGGRGGGF